MGIRHKATFGNLDGYYYPSSGRVKFGAWTFPNITIALKYIRDPMSGFYSPCLLYTSPSPRDRQKSRMPSSA